MSGRRSEGGEARRGADRGTDGTKESNRRKEGSFRTARNCPKPSVCARNQLSAIDGGEDAPGACPRPRRGRRCGLRKRRRRTGERSVAFPGRRVGSGRRRRGGGVDGMDRRIRSLDDDAPRGPSVTATASASLSIPAWILMRDFMSNVRSFASARTLSERRTPATRVCALGVVVLPASACGRTGEFHELAAARKTTDREGRFPGSARARKRARTVRAVSVEGAMTPCIVRRRVFCRNRRRVPVSARRGVRRASRIGRAFDGSRSAFSRARASGFRGYGGRPRLTRLRHAH